MNALDRAYSLVPGLECKGLCVECCGPVVPSDSEANRINERHGTAIDFDRKTLNCNQLKDGKCAIYADRPLLCRLWGSVEKMPCIFGCRPKAGLMSPRDQRKAMRLVYGESQ